ncbi:hypothetical protein LTR62_000135 [Meristemomyces frigidus]|uniref:Transglutaminase-like domain-containing protein n=1 Tax=Meristemomyces frigidus TaxID=1508187 RepID=A0AAN7TS37_9PEZI|nr:hypothetical protein LTR62_000135 [Meristemomyces frigidus]
MADDAGALSVKERIAQLKLNQVGRVPGQTLPASGAATSNGSLPKSRPPPPPPPRPTIPPRPQSTNVPRLQDHSPVTGNGITNQPEAERPCRTATGTDYMRRPSLPARTSSQSSQTPSLPPRRPTDSSPALPPRRPSDTPSNTKSQLSRRESNESMNSVATGRSSVSGMSTNTSQSDRIVKAPSYDASALPPLPPKRTEAEKQAYYDSGNKFARRSLMSTFSSPNVTGKQKGTTPPPSRRPSAQISQQPPLPVRSFQVMAEPPAPKALVPPPPKKSALQMGLGSDTRPPITPVRPGSVPQTNGTVPLAIPTGSRPDLATLQSSKPKLKGNHSTQPQPTQDSCLHCRDFSAVDAHAAHFPRQSVPNNDIGWLAQQLTAPFPSATDKARAIFTWHHHNIFYNTKAFFEGNIQPSTPQSTLQSGWAVCEGYAGLFAALALKAGLESYVVVGHGKGFGYSQLGPGDPLPSYNAGHAWNVVKIDNGQWKLIDACWGAGHICGVNNLYKQEFSPERFTQSNDEFGLDHFPGEDRQQYREDGRTLTWEEYITGNKRGCGADFFSGYTSAEGISETSFQPLANPIVTAQQGPSVRFSFQKICPHWDPVRNGKGKHYLYTLAVDNLEGTKSNHLPFQTNGDVWWVDVPTRDLGGPGQSVKILAVTSFRDQDGRGLTIKEYLEWKGRVAMAWAYVAKFDVA